MGTAAMAWEADARGKGRDLSVFTKAQRWSHSAGGWLLILCSTVALFPAQTALTRLSLSVNGTPSQCSPSTKACDLVLSDMWSLAYGSPRRSHTGSLRLCSGSPIGSMGRLAGHLAAATQSCPSRWAWPPCPGFCSFLQAQHWTLILAASSGTSRSLLAMACGWVT